MKRLLIGLGVLVAIVIVGLFVMSALSGNQIEEKAPPPNEFTLAFHDVTIAVGSPYFYLDGQANVINDSDLGVTPIIKDERSAIPLEVFDCAYGVKSIFDVSTQTVTSANDETGFKVVMKVGESSITINDKARKIESALFLHNSTVYLPLKMVLDNSDSKSTYEDSTKSIIITRKVDERTSEEKKAMEDFKKDSYNATILANAAAKLCTYNQTFIQMYNFSNRVTIGFDYIKEYLPNPNADFSKLLSGKAPWIISVYEQEYLITDSTLPEANVYFRGRFDLAPPPTQPPDPIIDEVPETIEDYENQLNNNQPLQVTDDEVGDIFGNNP